MGAESVEWPQTRRFVIESEIGRGAMGQVYRALDRERNDVVALKMLRHLDAETLLRFKNEFRAVQGLQHRNLVSLGELFEEDGRWFFSMELVRGLHFLRYVRPRDESATPGAATETTAGTSTRDLRGARPPVLAELPAPRLVRPMRAAEFDERRLRLALIQLGRGLNALHAANKVHRDIKPSNILVAHDDRLVLLDFGVVAEAAIQAEHDDDKVIGTAYYMAPEQAMGKPVGPAADWYAVGVMLYQALTGILPITGGPNEVLARKQVEDPLPAEELVAGVPADLAQLCRELLARDPRARPVGSEVLRRLDARHEAHDRFDSAPAVPFVGRAAELDALDVAFSEVQAGSALTLVVYGESGVGKSALVRHFVARKTADEPRLLVLDGRCYERESVPYKAIDGVIDSLTRQLLRLSPAEAQQLLPPTAALLAQVFPVMGRIESLARAPERAVLLDPYELRRRVFDALRALLRTLAAERPLIIIIDDLHWADADSLALLAEVMRPPDEPRLLLVATARTGSDVGQPVPLEDRITGARRTLRIDSLDREDAEQLVVRLLGPETAPAGVARRIAAEAAGHPLFIDELVRSRGGLGGLPQPLSLDDAITARVRALEPAVCGLLELVVLAGTPLRQDHAAAAAGADPAAFARHAAVLRAANLVRTNGARANDTIEAYHDRVREAVAAQVDAARRSAAHRRLSEVLEASGDADPERLGVHFRESGDRAKAAHYMAQAAAQAVRALAFDRAARLYRAALELNSEPAAQRPLQARLGEALSVAGRGVEAAAAFAAAAEGAEPVEARRFHWRAAEQLVRAGEFDEGVSGFRAVLKGINSDLKRSPRAAAISIVVRELQLRLHGLDFVEHREADVPPETLEQLDICWAAAAALSMVDPLRGLELHKRTLVRAIHVGEPYRIARALALDAGAIATFGGRMQVRARRLAELARSIAERIDHPHALGWAMSALGSTALQGGHWKEARDAYDRAEELLGRHLHLGTWEVDSLQIFSLRARAFLGELDELSRRVVVRLRGAEERGDRYAVTNLRIGFSNLAWLVRDQPDEARRVADEAIARWSQQGFHFQHYLHLLAQVQNDLYLGDGAGAHARLTTSWDALVSSSLMTFGQFPRLNSWQLRGRTALAAAVAQPDQARARLPACEADARRMEREKRGWSTPLARLLRAGVAYVRGQAAQSAELLRDAIAGLDAADMALYAAAARARLGALLAGDEGRALQEQAERFFATQRVANPARMIAMLTPGLSA